MRVSLCLSLSLTAQDLWSPHFCGEGAPEFAVTQTKPFPAPVLVRGGRGCVALCLLVLACSLSVALCLSRALSLYRSLCRSLYRSLCRSLSLAYSLAAEAVCA